MGKNLENVTTVKKAASDSAPGDMKKLDPAPGGGMIRTLSGQPSVHTKNTGGDLKNANGIDGGTSVVSK